MNNLEKSSSELMEALADQQTAEEYKHQHYDDEEDDEDDELYDYTQMHRPKTFATISSPTPQRPEFISISRTGIDDGSLLSEEEERRSFTQTLTLIDRTMMDIANTSPPNSDVFVDMEESSSSETAARQREETKPTQLFQAIQQRESDEKQEQEDERRLSRSPLRPLLSRELSCKLEQKDKNESRENLVVDRVRSGLVMSGYLASLYALPQSHLQSPLSTTALKTAGVGFICWLAQISTGSSTSTPPASRPSSPTNNNSPEHNNQRGKRRGKWTRLFWSRKTYLLLSYVVIWHNGLDMIMTSTTPLNDTNSTPLSSIIPSPPPPSETEESSPFLYEFPYSYWTMISESEEKSLSSSEDWTTSSAWKDFMSLQEKTKKPATDQNNLHSSDFLDNDGNEYFVQTPPSMTGSDDDDVLLGIGIDNGETQIAGDQETSDIDSSIVEETEQDDIKISQNDERELPSLSTVGQDNTAEIHSQTCFVQEHSVSFHCETNELVFALTPGAQQSKQQCDDEKVAPVPDYSSQCECDRKEDDTFINVDYPSPEPLVLSKSIEPAVKDQSDKTTVAKKLPRRKHRGNSYSTTERQTNKVPHIKLSRHHPRPQMVIQKLLIRPAATLPVDRHEGKMMHHMAELLISSWIQNQQEQHERKHLKILQPLEKVIRTVVRHLLEFLLGTNKSGNQEFMNTVASDWFEQGTF